MKARAALPELHSRYPVDADAIRSFRERGFVVLSGVFSVELLERYEGEISAQVSERNRNTAPLAERDTYSKAFLQITNLWVRSATVRAFVLGRRCARIAARLLGTSGVRIWHDQALYKEAGGGHTPWHCDQFFWPMASEKSVTAWIPLQATPLEMGPVYFAPGSHRHDYGRQLGISDRSDLEIGAAIAEAQLDCSVARYELGDVSFHAGWTMHRAEPNRTDRMRRVMTIIYIDEAMRLAEPANPFQKYDGETWCPGTAVGEVMRSPLNPVIYSVRGATAN